MVSYFLIINLTFLIFKLSHTILKAGKVSLGSVSVVAGVTGTQHKIVGFVFFFLKDFFPSFYAIDFFLLFPNKHE